MDLRRSLRIAVDLPARFRSETVSIDGRAMNLSQSGVRFLGEHAHQLARAVRRVNLEIDLPDTGTPIVAAGEIRWSSNSEDDENGAFGIRFTEIAVVARRRLANLILRAFAVM